MALTLEQIRSLKDQLRAQVSNLVPEKKEEAYKQIDEMSPEAIESLLRESQEKEEKSIFRRLIENEIPNVRLDENTEAISILDINPISKGHNIIIPKKPAKSPEEIPKEAFSLAESISKKIIRNLKAKSVKTLTETKMGESYINLIPIYDTELNLNSQRKQSNIEELESLKKDLLVEIIEKKVEKIPKQKKKRGRKTKFHRRIP